MTAPGGHRADFEQRMHRALEHIDRHLDQPLDLAAIAAVAHFSPYHFHRLFAAWTGETPGDFLRRRRVETAALRLLAQPRLSVLNAALSVGFGSGEAFTRAFRARFGAAPSAWRRKADQADRNLDQVLRNGGQAAGRPGFQHHGSFHPTPEPAMNLPAVKLIDRAPTLVAYLRHTGPYGDPIYAFWTQTVAPWMAANNLIGLPRYGISHDDPSITAPERCRYDACSELPPGMAAPAKMLTTTIPGGRYATLRFFGSADQVDGAWKALLRDWLPESGLQLDQRPCFEHYPVDARYDDATGAFECDICVPVAAR